MTRLGTASVVAAVLAAGSIGRAAAPAPTRDLWIGVLQDDLLVPIASLVKGRWTFLDSNDDSQRRELYYAEGKLPARWVDSRVLPRTWRAHLRNGDPKPVHVIGPLVHNPYDDEQRAVRTDSGLTDTGGGGNLFGIAIVGAVGVRLFREAPGADRPAVAEFMAGRAAQEARAAVKRRSASTAEDASVWAELSDAQVDSGSFEVERMLSATLGDGSVVSYLEELKYLAPDREVHVRATVLIPRSGRPRLVEITADTASGNNSAFEPLAILERDGVSCWLTAVLNEGESYVLGQPRHIANDCRLK